MTTSERLAYSNAWRTRHETGDASPAILINELRAQGVDPVWTDPDSEVHKWVMDCWQRAVTPRRLPLEATKKAASALPTITRAFREVLKALR